MSSLPAWAEEYMKKCTNIMMQAVIKLPNAESLRSEPPDERTGKKDLQRNCYLLKMEFEIPAFRTSL